MNNNVNSVGIEGWRDQMARINGIYKNKEKATKYAKTNNRKVLWRDEKDMWHYALDLRNTPYYALEINELQQTPNFTRQDFEQFRLKELNRRKACPKCNHNLNKRM